MSATVPGPKTKTAKKNNSKNLTKLIEMLKSPNVIGLIITLCFCLLASNFYQIRSMQEAWRHELPEWRLNLFKAVEWFDLQNNDLRFLMRGETIPDAPVALITIDDRSVEEIGRWPWSREKIAFVTDEMFRYGAKAVGFDIIFSEPQLDPTLGALSRIENKAAGYIPQVVKNAIEDEISRGEPDGILAATFEKHKEHITLGAFDEESDSSNLAPYQDYCRNEAFSRANAEKFVKLNTTFIVNDEADPFVDLEFNKVFDGLFPALENVVIEKTLKGVFQKSAIEELSPLELKQLGYIKQSAVMDYCEKWLTADDDYLEITKPVYLEIFKKSKDLQGLPIEQAIELFKSLSKPLPIVQRKRWTINTDRIQAAADFTGSFNAEQDADGVIRKASLFFRTGNRIGTSFIPSISLQTYLLATGYRANIEINKDPKNPEQKIITKFDIVNPEKDPEEFISSVPVDTQGRMSINYHGGTNMFYYLPAKEMFNNRETADVTFTTYNETTGKLERIGKTVNKAEFIKDRTFIIGATAIGVYDLRATPFEKKTYPGPETHLTAMSNLFTKNFLKVHPKENFWMLLALATLGLILSITISHTTAIPGFLATLASLGLLGTLDLFFMKKGYLVSMTLLGGLVLFLYIFLFFYRYLTEERKKKELRSTFSKYVSPAIVDEILKDPENIELGGKKQRMSVFFSDVRGFTTISEKLEPQALSDVLNQYLTPMTELVFANKGTLDKYMGDAVMAFFGAPISFPDHAKYACRCALASLRKLAELQKEFAAKNLPNIDIGIGINTGDMSVGNMGSDTVRSYTVMGDSVNLASRLEGINKEYGTRIIISEFTFADVKNDFTCREVDWVRVKGKMEPVRIFELISEGKADETKTKMLVEFQAGFELYHKKDFSAALAKFNHALEILPGDPVSEIYVERCQEYLNEPPVENWDGVYIMKTK
jgi:adenylate cyclase